MLCYICFEISIFQIDEDGFEINCDFSKKNSDSSQLNTITGDAAWNLEKSGTQKGQLCKVQ